MATRTINCEHCGKEVETRQPHTKYCPECRVRKVKEHGSRPRPEHLVGVRRLACIDCGNTFEARRSDAKFCPECQKRKQREWGKRARPERNTGRRAETYCAVCQRPFVAKRKDARLCPDHRRNRPERSQLDEFVPDAFAQTPGSSISCSRCETVFQARRSDTQYCSACYLEVRRETEQRSAERKKHSECPECGGRKHASSPLCIKCAAKKRTGENNVAWKGGKARGKGYVLVRQNRSDRKHKYRLEHVAVWESANGPLPKGWVVHHLNGVKDDNRLENLAGMARHEHHSRPREALVPYEARILALEARVRELETDLARPVV